MGKIGLIQVDGKMPNLALMKLSKWHRERGDDIFFIDLSSLNIDQWYGSKIFMGGSGYRLKEKLPEDIEIQSPDYELFNLDYSIGFTSRGCIRDCDFCIVKEKEGSLSECDFKHSIEHSKYILMDNNFLASSVWRDKLLFFIENNIKVSFNQGLDIRLINEEKIKLLSKVRYYDRKFKYRRLYFSFDKVTIEKVFREKIEIILKYIKAYHLMVYILTGFDTSFEEDLKRFSIIREYKCDPYIMIYNNKKDDPLLRCFARWVNKRIYKVCDFRDYKPLKRISYKIRGNIKIKDCQNFLFDE
jgi:hypothetical protein